jgi:hypothetical protein
MLDRRHAKRENSEKMSSDVKTTMEIKSDETGERRRYEG